MKREETDKSENSGHVHLPWEGRDDLIMTNQEYWEEIARLCPPSQEELMDLMFLTTPPPGILGRKG